MKYRYLNILCEGESEESFVKKVLIPYLEPDGIYVTPIILGGVSRYSGIRRELKRLGRDSFKYLTTMLDYYKLPQDVPGVRQAAGGEAHISAKCIEQAIAEDLENEITCKGFFPNLLMHEYEALLFSDVSCFRKCDGVTDAVIRNLDKVRCGYDNPEMINNSEQTAPSKRILQIYPSYQKVTDGTLIAEAIGIEKIMAECPHFAVWIDTIKHIE